MVEEKIVDVLGVSHAAKTFPNRFLYPVFPEVSQRLLRLHSLLGSIRFFPVGLVFMRKALEGLRNDIGITSQSFGVATSFGFVFFSSVAGPQLNKSRFGQLFVLTFL